MASSSAQNQDRPFIVNNVGQTYFTLFGLESRVINQMPYEERKILRRVFLFDLILLYIVFLAFAAISWQLLPGKIWLAFFIVGMIVPSFIWLLKKYTISYLDDQTKYPRVIQWYFQLFILLILVGGALGISMILNKDQIRNEFKRVEYQRETEKYVSDINRLETLAQAPLQDSKEKLLNSFYRYLNGPSNTMQAHIDSIKAQLNNSINDNIIRLNLYFLKKGEEANYDSLLLDNSDLVYARNISNGFISKKSDSIYQFNGVRFNATNEISIIENYNDSIYQAVQKIKILRSIANPVNGYLYRTRIVLDGDYNKFLPVADPEINTDFFRTATQTWLQKLLTSDSQEIGFRTQFIYFGRLLGKANEGVLYKTIVLVLIVVFIYLYWLLLMGNLKKSSYPRLVKLFRKSEKIKFEKYSEKLGEKEELLTEIDSKEEQSFSQEEKEAMGMLKDDGSFESYMGYAKVYQHRRDYGKALRWLEDGYEHFQNQQQYRRQSIEFLKSMAEVYRDAGDRKKSDEKMDEYYKALNDWTVVENMARKLSIDQYEVFNHFFYQDIHWKLQPGINILLGKNGYGKSHLISILLSILQNDFVQAKNLVSNLETSRKQDRIIFRVQMKEDKTIALNPEQKSDIEKAVEEITRQMIEEQSRNASKGFGHDKAEFELLLKSAVENRRKSLERKAAESKMIMEYTSEAISGEYGKIPVLAIPDSRFMNKFSDLISKNPEEIDLAKNGAWHFIYQAPYSSVIENFYYDACTEIYEKRENTFGLQSVDSPTASLIKEMYLRLTGITITKLEVKKPTLGVYEMLVTTDDLVENLPIKKVSQGTFSVISIVGVILSYLKFIYEGKVSPDQYTKQPAIVVIDEIDAHLHPSWQQKIINILRDKFPNIQFIITAHSPFIVAGCSEMEVSLLQKDLQTKKYFLTQFNQHFIGYSPDELCKVIFDIEKYDENFFTYVNQTPRKKELEEQISLLKANKVLTDAQNEQLEQYHYELYRILTAENRLKEQQAVSSK